MKMSLCRSHSKSSGSLYYTYNGDKRLPTLRAKPNDLARESGYRLLSSTTTIAVYYTPPVGKGKTRVAFVRPSVCPSVAYIANNSRTQRPRVHV